MGVFKGVRAHVKMFREWVAVAHNVIFSQFVTAAGAAVLGRPDVLVSA